MSKIVVIGSTNTDLVVQSLKNAKQEFQIAANAVEIVDTTVAGDIFNGAIAVGLAEGKDWKQAIAFANLAASIGVGRLGAQSSIPYRKEVEAVVKTSI